MNDHLKDDFTPEFNIMPSPEKVRAWREAHRCPECRRVTDSRTRIGNEHWPYCSEAPIENQLRWAKA